MLARGGSCDHAFAKIEIPNNLGLKPGDQCFVSGRLIGLNNPAIPTLQCNPEGVSRIPMSRDFLTPTDPNRIYVEGLGIVVKRENLTTIPVSTKPPIICTVRHNDWDQAKQEDVTFKVRYIIPSTTLLKSHALIQKGCEVRIAGYLVNTPSPHEPWLVQATGVSVLKNPPRSRKKERKIPTKPNELGSKLIGASVPAKKLIPQEECSCNVDRGEGSSSGSTSYHTKIQAEHPGDVITNFSSIDVKGKKKEIS